MNHHRSGGWRLLAVVAFLMTAACSSTGSTPTGVAGGTMTVRLNDDWGSLDIQGFVSVVAWYASEALYDRLVVLGPGRKIVPYLAESWKQTPTTISFTLRKDVTCADGTPVTATVVSNSFKRYFAVNQAFARQSFGPGPYTVTGDDATRTFNLTLGTPFTDAIYGFETPQTGIVCPAGLADPKQMLDKSFGSGAFVIDSFAHGDSLVLKGRPEWKWGPFGANADTPGFPQKLIYKVVPNETTAANLLATGSLDVSAIGGPDITRLLNIKSLHSNSVTPFYRYSMVMNETPGHPGADEAVRLALMSTIDPKSWNQAAYNGLGVTGTSLFPSDWECYEPATAHLVPKQPSPDKARSILLAAGYTPGSGGKLQKDGKPISVTVVAVQGQGSGPEYLADQFDKAGFTSNLKVVDYAANSLAIRTGNYDVAIQRPGAVDPAPGNSIALFSGPLPPKGTNFSFIIDPALDQYAASALGATGAQRCQDWRAVQSQLLQKHHLLPLSAPEAYAFSRGIDFQQAGGLGFIEPASLKRRAP